MSYRHWWTTTVSGSFDSPPEGYQSTTYSRRGLLTCMHVGERTISFVKVFWSWQSDTPGKTGRHLVRDALREAIEELKQDEDVEEAAREELHLDHDVQNEPGTPEIANTILRKIEESAVVVADVTLVGQVSGESKKLINSNVAIELGYAVKTLGWDRVLLVLNSRYGTPVDLPFDLRHRGGWVTFDLSPDADSTRIKTQKKLLRNSFVAKLKHAIQIPAIVAAPQFEPTPSNGTRARYFNMGEALVTEGIGKDKTEYRYKTDRLPYLRLMPTSPLPTPLSFVELKTRAQGAPMLSLDQNSRVERNHYGAIAFQAKGDELISSTQFFESGEIWMIGPHSFFRDEPHSPEFKDWPYPVMYSCLLEQTYWDGMRAILGALGTNSAFRESWNIELGLAGLNSVHMVVPGDWGPNTIRLPGPNFEAEIWHQSSLKEGDGIAKIDEILLAFFSRVFDKFGVVGAFRPAAPPHDNGSHGKLPCLSPSVASYPAPPAPLLPRSVIKPRSGALPCHSRPPTGTSKNKKCETKPIPPPNLNKNQPLPHRKNEPNFTPKSNPSPRPISYLRSSPSSVLRMSCAHPRQ